MSVTLFSQDQIAEIENLQLATALITLGVEPLKDPSRVVSKGKADKVIWLFSAVSVCGKYETKDLVKKWNDKKWLSDPSNEHPLSFLACQMHNYNCMKATIFDDSKFLAVINKGRKYALLPLNSDEEHRNQLFKHS